MGNAGRDLILGGLGRDSLDGGKGEDTLVGGTTAFDADRQAIDAVMAEWTSGRGFHQRQANLSGHGTGPRLNGDVFLKASGPGATVFDDAAVDELKGGHDLDWLFATLGGPFGDDADE